MNLPLQGKFGLTAAKMNSYVNAEERKFSHLTIYVNVRACVCLPMCLPFSHSLTLFYHLLDDVLPQPISNWFIYHTDFILRHSYYLLFNCLNYSSSFKRHSIHQSLSLSSSLAHSPCFYLTLHKMLEVAWHLPQIIRNIRFSKCG